MEGSELVVVQVAEKGGSRAAALQTGRAFGFERAKNSRPLGGGEGRLSLILREK